MNRIIPGRNMPILVCMECGGYLKKEMGGYVCSECGHFHTLEEAGLQGVGIASVDGEAGPHCPKCGGARVGVTHNMAEQAVYFCDDCGEEWPYR